MRLTLRARAALAPRALATRRASLSLRALVLAASTAARAPAAPAAPPAPPPRPAAAPAPPPRPPPAAPASSPAPAAPAAAAARPAAERELYVLHFASLRQDDYQAIRLTKALEQRALASGDQRLINSNQALLVLLERARCGAAFRERAYAGGAPSLDERAGQGVEAECLEKLAALLGAPGGPAPQYLWGYVHRDARGRLYATAHLWRKGEADRRVTLPVDERAPADALAERLYRHLLDAGRVGDVRLEAPAGVGGEVYVDGRPRGPFRQGHELTLDAGERRFELRREGRRVAAARVTVRAGATAVMRFAPDAPAPAAAPPAHEASALPWVLGGVGAAGLVGAVVFQLLRRDAEGDLERRCVAGQWCFPQEQATIDRAESYATVSGVAAGVAAAGLGAAAWLLLARPGPAARPAGRAGVSGALAPIAGGGGAFILGRF